MARVQAAFAAVGGRARFTAWWNGAAADALLDEAHASIAERALRVFQRRGWRTLAEVTFSEYGERGSIDVFASYEQTRAVAVCEVKASFGSLEETNRMLDVKVRLAVQKLAKSNFGFQPRHVARLLIVPNESTIRRTVARHAATMDSIYPTRSRDVRAWLRQPSRSISGIWFVSYAANATRAQA